MNIDRRKFQNLDEAALPEMCYSLIPTEPDGRGDVVIITRGVYGYRRTNWPKGVYTAAQVLRFNSEIEVSPEEAYKLELMAMMQSA